MRLEDLLLLSCATTNVDAERAARIRELTQGDIDWPYLVQIAHRHGVMPLLYKNLRENALEIVPEAILSELRKLFRSNTLHNLILTSRLLQVLDLFKAHNLPAIPYKGPALSVLAYGDIDLRQFCDIDLFIHQQDVFKAKEALLLKGYKPEKNLTPAQESVYLKNECEYDFYSGDGKVLLELHWNIVKPYYSCSFDMEALWDNLKPLSLLGKEVMTLSPEESLLIICIHHGGKHQWEMLGWISDVAQLIVNHRGMDWERVMKQAVQSGIERMLLLGLSLAKDLIGVEMPDVIVRRIAGDRVIKSFVPRIAEQIFDQRNNRPGEMKGFISYLRMRERMRDKARYCIGRLLTSTENDWAALKLPAPLFFLYRFIRPFRLAKKYFPQLFGRLCLSI